MKRVIKYICYKIYIIGKIEYNRIINLEQSNVVNFVNRFEKLATIHPEAKVEEAKIYNRFNDKSKIFIGKKSQIRGEMEAMHFCSKITIGDYSYVGPGTRIYCCKEITIGNRVLISHNVNIFDNNSHPLDAELRHKDFMFIFDNGYQDDIRIPSKEIIIKDDVWIGFNSIILKGVTIGKGAIVGAGTMITQDVPDYAVIVGNPARIVKYTN